MDSFWYTYVLWFLILLPIPIAITVFFISSRKNLLKGYLLGLLPIFLVWQIVSILTLPEPIDSDLNHLGEGTGLFLWLFYTYLIVIFIYYTGWSLSLWGTYRWVIHKARIKRRSFHIMLAIELAILLGIGWAVGFVGLYLLFSRINIYQIFIILPIFIGSWLHYHIGRFGIPFFIVLDGILLILSLVWILLARWLKKRKAGGGFLKKA